MAKGWGKPGGSNKFHYFEEGKIIPLCSKWMWGGALEKDALEEGHDDHKENCAACKRLRLKETQYNARMKEQG